MVDTVDYITLGTEKGTSKENAISIDDDQYHVPAARMVQPRHRNRLDDEGFEELVQPEQLAYWGRAAAGKEKRRQSGSNIDRGGPSGWRRESISSGQDGVRTVSVKPPNAAYIELLSDDDEAAPNPPDEVIQQAAVPAQRNQAMSLFGPVFRGTPAPTPNPVAWSNTRVPQPKAGIPLPAARSRPPTFRYVSTAGTRHSEEAKPHDSPVRTTRLEYIMATAPVSAERSLLLVPPQSTASASPTQQPPPNSEPTADEPASLQSSKATESEQTISAQRRVDSRESPTQIRDFADHDRERATSSPVNIALERASAAIEAEVLAPIVAMPVSAPRSQGPSMANPLSKKRAIKTVKRRDDATPRSCLPVRQQHQPSASKKDQPYELSDRAYRKSTLTPSPPIDRRQGNETITYTEGDIESNLTRKRDSQDLEGRSAPTTSQSRQNEANSTHSSPVLTPMAQLSAGLEVPRIIEQDLQTPLPAVDETTTRATSAVVGDLDQSSTYFEHSEAAHSGTQTKTRLPIQVDDLTTARVEIQECLSRHLEERYETHAYLCWSKMWRQRTCQEQALRARTRKSKRPSPPTLPERYIQRVSPFENMSSIHMPCDKNSTAEGFPDLSQETYVKNKPKDTKTRSVFAVPTTRYKSTAVKVPPFKEYVGLRNSVLADNESKLLATPYLEDQGDDFTDALAKYYEMTHDENGPLDLRKEQCRFYKDGIEAFLAEVGVSWNDVLYWLLAPSHVIRRINDTLSEGDSFEATLLERSQFEGEEFMRDIQRKVVLFNRNSKYAQDLFNQLEEPTAITLRLSAIACMAVFQECEFGIWYLARQSEIMHTHILRKTEHGRTAPKSTYRQAMCRVCYQHHCLLHGEVREVPGDTWKVDDEDDEDDEDDDEESEDFPEPAHLQDDSDVEKVINYKLLANPDAFNTCAESEMITPKGKVPPSGKFNVTWWFNETFTAKWEKRRPFFPCSHEGSCESANCRCFRENINCEKTCRCSRQCNRRFPGCSCVTTLGKQACSSSTCLCSKFGRECDADLCGSCGAMEVLDPVNRYNEGVVQGKCNNVAIQRNVPRKTLLGHSEVHGFGLYMGEDINRGEYIGEYTGEAISVKEGDRRGVISTYQQTMYLFKLSSKQEVDATYMGNKLRFINNADDKYTNCAPKNLLCNTVFRIALYATTNIKAGTELFFTYNYPKELTASFKQPNGKLVAVKQVKPKIKNKSSLHRSGSPTHDPSPAVLAAAAKARAAKAAKRAAMLAEQAAQTSASKITPHQRARKTVTHQFQHSEAPGLRAVKSVRTSANRAERIIADSGTDVEASDHALPLMSKPRRSQAARYVRDSEDDYTVEESPQLDDDDAVSEIEETAQEESDEPARRRRSGRPRKIPVAVPPVVAVKKKMGGARPGAGRKRKRPVVINSDDDE